MKNENVLLKNNIYALKCKHCHIITKLNKMRISFYKEIVQY